MMRSHEGDIPVVLFRPTAGGRHPGVVIGAEATGVNTFIRNVGSKIAREGYAVVIPDYYHGGG